MFGLRRFLYIVRLQTSFKRVAGMGPGAGVGGWGWGVGGGS